MEGRVQATYMFKDLLNGNTPVIALLPDTTDNHPSAMIEEKSFGLLRVFSENLLVSWNEGTLFIVNPEEGTFLGWHSNLGHVRGLSICKGEIYILRDEPRRRKVVRIAQERDLLNEPGKAAF